MGERKYQSSLMIGLCERVIKRILVVLICLILCSCTTTDVRSRWYNEVYNIGQSLLEVQKQYEAGSITEERLSLTKSGFLSMLDDIKSQKNDKDSIKYQSLDELYKLVVAETTAEDIDYLLNNTDRVLYK